MVGIAGILLIAACPIPNAPVSSEDKDLTAFSFTATDNTALSADVTGTISGTDIDLIVPYGTDVTALVATFTTTGVSVSVGGTVQTSGVTENDYTIPLTYTVTAEDSTTRDYTLTVAISTAAAEGSGFASAVSPGDTGVLTLREPPDESIIMVYAQDQASISFPMFIDDAPPATLTTRFWMAQTEFTNSQAAAVLQWAHDNGRFSSTVGDHNGLDSTTAKHGGQQLIDLDSSNCRVDYDGAEIFSAETGYEDYPVTNLTLFGAIMLCNWLTEMRDGHTNNLVYGGITDSWDYAATTEATTKNGYRLPSGSEWEYAARYLGTTAPLTGGNLDSERKYGNDNPNWTDGYYWTPGNYASGATTYYNDATGDPPAGKLASDLVAVYRYYWDGTTWIERAEYSGGPESVAGLESNTLGLYDMSGNVGEWFYSASNSSLGVRNGYWGSFTSQLRVGFYSSRVEPDTPYLIIGFRLCRTAD
jgi:formylglycine-generating enzyme required for sulfatase activity